MGLEVEEAKTRTHYSIFVFVSEYSYSYSYSYAGYTCFQLLFSYQSVRIRPAARALKISIF